MWKSYPLHKACGGGKAKTIFPENRCFYAGKRPDISGKTPEHLPSNASAFQIKRRNVCFQKQELLFFTLETSLNTSFQKQQKETKKQNRSDFPTPERQFTENKIKKTIISKETCIHTNRPPYDFFHRLRMQMQTTQSQASGLTECQSVLLNKAITAARRIYLISYSFRLTLC